MRKLIGLTVALVLSGCGGGGDVAGDVSAMSIIPSEYSGKCSTGQTGISFDVTHTINGGRPPFRVRTHSEWVQVGYADPKTNAFVAAPESAFNSEGDLTLTGKDPKFAVRYLGLACGATAEASVTVLDYHSKTVSPTYTAEEAEDEAGG